MRKVIGNAKKDALLGQFHQQFIDLEKTGGFRERAKAQAYWLGLEKALKERGDIPQTVGDVTDPSTDVALGWHGPDHLELYYMDNAGLTEVQNQEFEAMFAALLGGGDERRTGTEL